MRRSLSLLLVLPAVLLAGCPKESFQSCDSAAEKGAFASVMYDWYLYPELLPQTVDPSKYGSTAELLDAMTAKARLEGKDRGWTYVTTASASQTFFQEGTSVGVGIGLLARAPDLLFVSQVYPGSAAAAAGFRRGDQILRIGDSAATLAPVGPAVAAGLADPNDTKLGDLVGPATAGLVRVFEVIPAGSVDQVPVQRTATKGTFALDPVPVVDPAGGTRFRIVERNGKKLGYVWLRSFISPANAQLADAMKAFHDAGVTDVALDLRYNGGGLVDTATVLADLLGGGLAGTMWKMGHNPDRAPRNDVTAIFGPPAVDGRPVVTTAGTAAVPIAATRVAFITTGSSASASELVPNVLEAYLGTSVALVGARTYGKPVGQRGFQRQGCDTIAFVVSFRLENAQGDGAYYDGLPDAGSPPAFSGPLCAAEDDLAHDLGDPAEASTAAALEFLDAGTCPAPPAPAAPLGLTAARPPDGYPLAAEPSLAQRHVNGLF